MKRDSGLGDDWALEWEEKGKERNGKERGKGKKGIR